MKKTCTKCEAVKELEQFYYCKSNADRRLNECKECTKERVSNWYSKNKEHCLAFHRDRYRNSESWLIVNKYNGIKTRCSGKKKRKYTVAGMQCLSLEEFKEWWQENRSDFLKIHKEWKKSNYNTSLSPSIDRIDNSKGYIKNNMQWLTHSQNSRKHKN